MAMSEFREASGRACVVGTWHAGAAAFFQAGSLSGWLSVITVAIWGTGAVAANKKG